VVVSAGVVSTFGFLGEEVLMGDTDVDADADASVSGQWSGIGGDG